MKRVLAFLLAAALLFAFCGCGTKDDPDTTDTTVPEQSATARPTPVDILHTLDSDRIYQINSFLSTFSEQSLRTYPCSDNDLIQFGYHYALVRHYQVLGMEGEEFYMSRKSMDAIINRFFGTTAPVPADSHQMRYADETYYFPITQGKIYAVCSVATTMYDNGDGTYSVDFVVFGATNPATDMTPYYSMNREQIAQQSELTYQYTGRAVVRNFTRADGVESYQLISYNR